MARPLDRHGQGPLVFGARPQLSPGLNLAALGDVAADAGDVLVVDLADAVDAKLAYLAARRVPAPTPRAPAAGTTSCLAVPAAAARPSALSTGAEAGTRRAAVVPAGWTRSIGPGCWGAILRVYHGDVSSPCCLGW